MAGSGRILDVTLLMGYYNELDTSAVERFSVVSEPVETSTVADLDYSILRVIGDPSENWGTVTLAATDPEPAASLLLIHHQ